MAQWSIENWLELVTAVCGIVGLWFAACSIRMDTHARKEETKARKLSNLLAITANHRETWKEFYGYPQLARVIEPSANTSEQPVTPAEEFFVNTIISNTSSTYEALKDGLLTEQEGLRRDVKEFFSLPIPNAVWRRTKLLQNQDFAAFIESSLKS